MIDDIDVYRAAQLVMQQHGNDAADFASDYADELLATGDVEGSVVWTKIVRAIDEIQALPRPGDPIN
jgi:hypothetical protein